MFYREDGPTEIEGIEVTETTMIEEGLLQDTVDVALLLETLDVVFLLMIIVVVEEATMIEAVETIMDHPEEEEATEDMVLLVMIRIMTGHQLQEMLMDPHVVVLDHLHPSVAVMAAVVPSVVVVAAEEVGRAVDVKKEKEFQESHCWFETSVLLLPIKILVWRLDVLAMFVMFTSQEITIHSNRKASHLSSMPMPTVSSSFSKFVYTNRRNGIGFGPVDFCLFNFSLFSSLSHFSIVLSPFISL